MPEWGTALALQIPLVAAVTYAFLSGAIHTRAELDRREKEHEAELARRSSTLEARAQDWRDLYEKEREDRIDAAQRLAAATDTIRAVIEKVDDLTREVIRNGSR